MNTETVKEDAVAPSVLNAGLGAIYLLEIEINSEGGKLAYLSKEGDDGAYRIAGPKAWGGSTNIARLKINQNDLVEFIKSYAPEIIALLRSPA